MARILRGDIHWADLNPVIGSGQGGFRPVLILSHKKDLSEKIGTLSKDRIFQILQGIKLLTEPREVD